MLSFFLPGAFSARPLSLNAYLQFISFIHCSVRVLAPPGPQLQNLALVLHWTVTLHRASAGTRKASAASVTLSSAGQLLCKRPVKESILRRLRALAHECSGERSTHPSFCRVYALSCSRFDYALIASFEGEYSFRADWRPRRRAAIHLLESQGSQVVASIANNPSRVQSVLSELASSRTPPVGRFKQNLTTANFRVPGSD